MVTALGRMTRLYCKSLTVLSKGFWNPVMQTVSTCPQVQFNTSEDNDNQCAKLAQNGQRDWSG
jgi:hypothetical protein